MRPTKAFKLETLEDADTVEEEGSNRGTGLRSRASLG